jgi:signal transduction protein with GAF and PtsI domain
MNKQNSKDDLLSEIEADNKRLTEFINDINSKIKKTDEKLAKTIVRDDLNIIELYKKNLNKKK